jgi:hypothetical protein
MTCKHALDLIDIGPFADIPGAQRDAARRHASECAACAQALTAADALGADLRDLPQPALPPDFTAALMARIARIEPSDDGRARAQRRANDAASMAPLAAGVLIVLYALLASGSRPGFHSAAARVVPTTASAALALTVGLTLYVIGLFGPIRRALRR